MTASTSVLSSSATSSSSNASAPCDSISVRRLKDCRSRLNNVELAFINLALVWLSIVDRKSSKCSDDAYKKISAKSSKHNSILTSKP